jgi:hypothetical protein
MITMFHLDVHLLVLLQVNVIFEVEWLLPTAYISQYQQYFIIPNFALYVYI